MGQTERFRNFALTRARYKFQRELDDGRVESDGPGPVWLIVDFGLHDLSNAAEVAATFLERHAAYNGPFAISRIQRGPPGRFLQIVFVPGTGRPAELFEAYVHDGTSRVLRRPRPVVGPARQVDLSRLDPILKETLARAWAKPPDFGLSA